MNGHPSLLTRHLALEPLGLQHAAEFHALGSDPDVMRYASIAPMSRAESDALLQDWMRSTAKGETCSWLLRARDSGEFLGQVSLFNIDRANLRAEVGYLLMPSAWGKGYASEAVTAAIRHAFGYLGLCRLEADIDPANVASARVLEKNGFRREGIMPKRWYKEGRFYDTWYYGLLNERLIRELESKKS